MWYLYLGGEGWLGFQDLRSGQKPWWNWCLTPVVNFGEVRRAQLGQIHSPHLYVGTPGIFSDLLRSVQMLKRESGVRKATGSYCTYSIPSKTAALVPEFAVEDLPSAELQPRFLRLQWRNLKIQQNSVLVSLKAHFKQWHVCAKI